MKRITKSTVAAVLKKIDTNGLTVELDSETVTFWYSEQDKEYDLSHEVREAAAKAACEAVCEATGATKTLGNGSKFWINYKRETPDMGDWNDRSSRWHY